MRHMPFQRILPALMSNRARIAQTAGEGGEAEDLETHGC